MDYLLIAIALGFLTAGQLLQKLSVNRAARDSGRAAVLGELLLRRETWWAAACLGLGALTWFAVLYRMEVSKAFPALGLVTILVILSARIHLREHVPWSRWLGVVLVAAGVALVAST